MIETTAEKARAKFDVRKVAKAAQRVLNAETRDGRLFLLWLADACHATETVARGTPEETFRAIGRREVWLMLQDLLHVSEDDLRQYQTEDYQ